MTHLPTFISTIVQQLKLTEDLPNMESRHMSQLARALVEAGLPCEMVYRKILFKSTATSTNLSSFESILAFKHEDEVFNLHGMKTWINIAQCHLDFWVIKNRSIHFQSGEQEFIPHAYPQSDKHYAKKLSLIKDLLQEKRSAEEKVPFKPRSKFHLSHPKRKKSDVSFICSRNG